MLNETEETHEETKRLAGELEDTILSTRATWTVLSAHGGTERRIARRLIPVMEGYDIAHHTDFPFIELSPVDIAIVDEESREVKVLCEIAEDGASLNEILGRQLNILVSTRLMVEGRCCYDYGERSRWILGVRVPKKEGEDPWRKSGSLDWRSLKVLWRIIRHLGPYSTPTPVQNFLPPFPYICCHPDMEAIKNRIKEMVKMSLGMELETENEAFDFEPSWEKIKPHLEELGWDTTSGYTKVGGVFVCYRDPRTISVTHSLLETLEHRDIPPRLLVAIQEHEGKLRIALDWTHENDRPRSNRGTYDREKVKKTIGTLAQFYLSELIHQNPWPVQFDDLKLG